MLNISKLGSHLDYHLPKYKYLVYIYILYIYTLNIYIYT